ncbi:MAG: BrnT family toxin [Nitrospirae bacterium]|nr:MAG: BrnT family toxin [Nitrospirota bacterium]
MIDLGLIEGFDWDEGNAYKSDKHGISSSEAEQIFINEPLLLLCDEKHSQKEPRYHALGKTNDGRILHVTFTLREKGTKIRVISARPAHKKERVIYEQKTKAGA